MLISPWQGRGWTKSIPPGSRKKKGELKTKTYFRLFKAPFFFVGWLAPANGMDEVNPSEITHLTKTSHIHLKKHGYGIFFR
jgi:hypothetical protein